MFDLAFALVFGLPAWSACVPVEVEVLLPWSVRGAASGDHQCKFLHDQISSPVNEFGGGQSPVADAALRRPNNSQTPGLVPMLSVS